MIKRPGEQEGSDLEDPTHALEQVSFQVMKSGDTGGPVEVQYPASNFQWGGFDASSVHC